MPYQAALSTPTHESQFFLITLFNENSKKSENMEKQMEQSKNSKAKGSRTSRVGGEKLKSKLKSGSINNQIVKQLDIFLFQIFII